MARSARSTRRQQAQPGNGFEGKADLHRETKALSA
jgi:hypothetical protein